MPQLYICIYISLTKQEESAAHAVCLGSHAAHGGCGLARTMRAQRELQLAPRNNYYIIATAQIFVIKWMLHYIPQGIY